MFTKSGIYFHCDGFSVESMKELCGVKHRRIVDLVNRFFENNVKIGFEGVCRRQMREPFALSRFMGVSKLTRKDIQ